jgi:hypothetical protein
MNDKRTNRTGHRLERVLQRLAGTLSAVVKTTSPAPAAPLPAGADGILKTHQKQSFSDSLFAELLLELPMHRRRLSHAHETGDTESLGKATHQLLGAVVYCEAPELEMALRELRQATRTGEQHTIDACHVRAINVLDSTLRCNSSSGR